MVGASFIVHPEPASRVQKDDFSQIRLSRADFQKISRVLYQFSGICLQPGKEELVRSRLLKRLRALDLHNFRDYLKHVFDDKTAQELRTMIDCLTTNKTSFFRENKHFNYMRTRILPEVRNSGKGMRLWSAGCSSGEEPYSIAMLLKEELPTVDPTRLKILATDISDTMLAKARAAEYDRQSLAEIPPNCFVKYFTPVSSGSNQLYRVDESIKRMIRFARLNLMADWPMKGPFDLIFCRNVMIYFDNYTQQKLVRRFWDILAPGGHLFVGHSESLVASSAGFRYVEPATYVKI